MVVVWSANDQDESFPGDEELIPVKVRMMMMISVVVVVVAADAAVDAADAAAARLLLECSLVTPGESG